MQSHALTLKNSIRSQRRRSGFTLVEVMIALTIFGIVIAQAFAIFGAQHVTYAATERTIEVQQDSRLLADAILGDLRMAGYMVPRAAGISSQDGGNAAADGICISDPAAIQDSEVADANERFDAASLSSALSNGATSAVLTATTLSAANLDIDGDGNDDFSVGSGIIIADSNNSHCAVILSIVGQVIGFTPPTPAGFAIAASSGNVTPAVIYQVIGTDLERNGLRLANGIEDLQIEFGVDTNGDGQLTGGEFPVNTLNGLNPADVQSVRLSVISRTDREDDTLKTPGRPAAANRAAGAVDGFRRRRVTATVVPRNLL